MAQTHVIRLLNIPIRASSYSSSRQMKVSFDNLGHVLFKLLVLLILFVFLLNFKVSINVNYRDLSMNNKICQRFFKIIGKLVVIFSAS